MHYHVNVLILSNGLVKMRKVMNLNRQVSTVLHKKVLFHHTRLYLYEKSCGCILPLIRIVLTGHGRPCWVTHLVFCHLLRLKGHESVWLSSLSTSELRQFYRLYLQVSQFIVQCFLECTALSCKVFRLTRSQVFSWIPLFSIQMSGGFLGRILSTSRPL